MNNKNIRKTLALLQKKVKEIEDQQMTLQNLLPPILRSSPMKPEDALRPILDLAKTLLSSRDITPSEAFDRAAEFFAISMEIEEKCKKLKS